MTILRGAAFLLSVLTCAAQAQAAGVVIGVVAPQNGTFASLGAQIIAGAEQQIRNDGNTMVVIDESCEDNSGGAVADALIKAKAVAAIGFLCSETLEGALPKFKDASLPAITVSVRARILMEDALKNNWPLLRLAPSDGDEAKKVVEVILRDWASSPTALIDDGTVHGRELSDAVRNALEARGLKPVFTDTYRPGQEQQIGLVRRLKRAGAAKVFIAGDRRDVSIVVRDANAEKLSLEFLSGDAMRAPDQPVPLAEGMRAVVLPDGSVLPQSKAFVQAMSGRGTEPEGYTLSSASAASIAGQALAKVRPRGAPLLSIWIGTTFQTPMGAIAFGPNQELSENPYKVMEWRNGAFALPGQPTD